MAARKRGNFSFYDSFSWYVPGVAQMFILLALFLLGALLGNAVAMVFTSLLGAEAAMDYMMIVSYPIMFLPAMFYARIKSRNNSIYTSGVKMDSKHFGKMGGALCAVLAVLSTFAVGFCADGLLGLLPPMSDRLKALFDSMTTNSWTNYICVCIFAPFFEEWLCRGTILRGLLHKGIRPVCAIVISSVFFALIHANLHQGIAAFIIACLLGFVYYKTGSLKLTMLMHCANNTLSLVVSNIESLKEYERWDQMFDTLPYIVICVACLLLLVLIIRSFARIENVQPEGNSDKVNSLFTD